jgi:uncharacterized protein (TIGR03435 family)
MLSAAAFGQAPAARPEFEVASVKPSPPTSAGQAKAGVHADGAQVRMTYVSLTDLLRTAYRVRVNQVLGPDWFGSERFDVAAKLPEGATREQVPAMLQTLLADRFQLKTHRDSKDFSVYALVAGKTGIKAKEVPPDADADAAGPGRNAVDVAASGSAAGVSINLGKGASFALGNNRLEAHKLTMASFASMLERFVDRPVVDMTGTKGRYDFVLELTPEDYRLMLIQSAVSAGVVLPPGAREFLIGASPDSLFAAMQAQGLKLEARKAPLDVVVVDSARRTPAENESLGPRRAVAAH